MGKKRFTGLQLSQTSKLSQNYLAKRLRDELPFTLNDIQKIADALGIKYSDLVLPAALAHDRAKGKTPRNKTSPNGATI